MKILLIKILAFSLMLLFRVSASAQCLPYENILPQNPTPSDVIYLDVKHCSNNSPCGLVGESISIDSVHNNIQVDATYEPCSPFASPTFCQTIDQIQIGQLDSGSYNLVFNKIHCQSGDTVVTKNMNFTVQGGTPISGDIDSLAILPVDPFEDDTVKVVGHTGFNKSGCYMSGASLTFSSDSVYVDAYHVEGAVSASCNSTDTTIIGKLDTGTYVLQYRLRDSANEAVLDSATISFYVREALSPACIDSLNTFPDDATTEDTVNVIAHTYFPHSACYITGFSVNVVNDSIRVHAVYNSGNMTMICHSTDTISIGVLSEGGYQLVYYMVDSVSGDTLDIEAKQLSIQCISAVGERPAEVQPVVYPNPAHSNIHVSFSALPPGKFAIELFTVTGQIVKSKNTTEKSLVLDISNLDKGVYFMVITRKQGMQWIHKVIKY